MVGRLLPERKIHARTRLVGVLPTGGVGVEVGVWRGNFAEVLLRGLRPERLVLVDPWKFRPEHERALYGGASARSQEDMDRVHREVVARFGSESRVEIRREVSAAAAGEVGAESIDWVYLDADHTYDAVRRDLDRWTPKVRPGGYICGDDYGVSGWWGDGVTRAVLESVRDTELTPVLLYGGQYALRKPGVGETR